MAPVQPQHWQGLAQFIPASFLLVADKGSDDRIAGFWQVKFVAEGNLDIPDGTPIDDGLAQWHSDGTEIMHSGLRPSVTGN